MPKRSDGPALDWTEYVAVTLSFVVTIALSVKSANSKTSVLNDIKRNSLPFCPVIISLTASTLSGVTLLGKPAESYAYGTAFFNFYTIAAIMQLITVLSVFLPILESLQTSSLYEYFELRFDRRVRLLTTAVFIILKILYTANTTIPPAIVISQFFGHDINFIIIVITSVTTFYTTLGGLKGVVYTDTFQGIVMFLSVALLTILSVYKVGGIGRVIDIAHETNRLEFPQYSTADVTARTSVWVYFGFLYSLSATLLNHSVYQRIKSLKAPNSIKMALKLHMLGILSMSLGATFVGLAIYAFYYGCDPKMSLKIPSYSNLVVYWLDDVGRDFVGLRGTYIAGITCAAISTMSANLNSAADLVGLEMGKTNFVKRQFYLRCSTLVFGALSSLLAVLFKSSNSLIELNFSAITLEGVITSMFILGAVIVPANTRGALAGGITSLLITLFLTIGSRIYSRGDNVHYGTKLMRTDLCPANSTLEIIPPAHPRSNSEGFLLLFNISPFCLGVFTVLITLFVGTVVSVLFPSRTPVSRDPNLYTPLVRKFLKESKHANDHRDENLSLRMLPS